LGQRRMLHHLAPERAIAHGPPSYVILIWAARSHGRPGGSIGHCAGAGGFKGRNKIRL
jgi:hypothetical protein